MGPDLTPRRAMTISSLGANLAVVTAQPRVMLLLSRSQVIPMAGQGASNRCYIGRVHGVAAGSGDNRNVFIDADGQLSAPVLLSPV